MTEPSRPSGRVVVVAFLLICFVLAAFSVLVTLSGRWMPPPEPEAPPVRSLPSR